MASPLVRRAFWVATGICVAAEGIVLYQQWPQPPLKVCASFELGDLMAAASRLEADLRAARMSLQKDLQDGTTKEVMRLEAATATAWNEVAKYKQKDLERQKATGKGARTGECR